MAQLTIYKDNYIESTAVSNYFIDKYMKDANDAQLKVYLYLLRMVHANMAFGVSDIADKFNHTEKDVLRALRYWEKQKLLSLDYDKEKTLVGIHLCELNPRESGTLSDHPLGDGGGAVALQPQEPVIIPDVQPAADMAARSTAGPINIDSKGARKLPLWNRSPIPIPSRLTAPTSSVDSKSRRTLPNCCLWLRCMWEDH